MQSGEQGLRRRIRQLDERTIGFIAAGEVVERPAQVVKELLENSIDAGATRIDIELRRGGFDLIRVKDDGHGISRDDLSLSLDRHATSKLLDAEDLAAIGTLGFRGEALASIGMVSELVISSRCPEAEEANGWTISMANGEKGSIEQCGTPDGTTVEVKDIFANQPARLAFQRRPSTESVRTLDVVVKQAMASPEVRIRLVNDDKVLLEAPESEVGIDRLHDLMGLQAARFLPLSSPTMDEEAPGDERWEGWISPPDISRSRGDEVHILINGRPVASQPFLAAIRRGYHTRLMVGRHPVCVLSLYIPPDEVDVNVHPTKREVRLKNSWRVLERLERAIGHTLSTTPTDTSIDEESPLAGLRPREVVEVVTETASKPPSWVQSAVNKPSEQMDLTGEPAEEKIAWRPGPRPVSTAPAAQTTLDGLDSSPVAPALSSQERDLHRYSGNAQSDSPLDEPEAILDYQNELPEMEPLAQFADSYILAQAGDSLYIVDQHALHERIRYERLRNSLTSWSPQPLIESRRLELSLKQGAAAEAHAERLRGIGMEIEEQDGEWWLTCIPRLLVGDNSLDSFIDDLLVELAEAGDEGRLDAVEDLQDGIAFMKSCRGAVKANQRLELSEMRRLLHDMRTIPNPWACVHGRPTVLNLDADTLDHHFGRHG